MSWHRRNWSLSLPKLNTPVVLKFYLFFPRAALMASWIEILPVRLKLACGSSTGSSWGCMIWLKAWVGIMSFPPWNLTSLPRWEEGVLDWLLERLSPLEAWNSYERLKRSIGVVDPFAKLSINFPLEFSPPKLTPWDLSRTLTDVIQWLLVSILSFLRLVLYPEGKDWRSFTELYLLTPGCPFLPLVVLIIS